jgi:hypothetical protein
VSVCIVNVYVMGSVYSMHGKDEKCIQNFSHVIAREQITWNYIKMCVQGIVCELAWVGSRCRFL